MQKILPKSRRCLAAQIVSTEALEPQDIELREGLKWQCAIADAIFAYMDSVPAAFEALLLAHEKLTQAGIVISDTAPDASPLLERLREATGHILDVVGSTSKPLRTIRGTLQACSDDMKQADIATSELRHYSQKVKVLTSDNFDQREKKKGVAAAVGRLVGKTNTAQRDCATDSPTKVSARIRRNREKMHHWADEASVRQARTRDTLKACLMRQESMIKSAQDVVCSVVQAIGTASGCRPAVENVSTGPLVRPLDGSLVFSLGITPRLWPSVAPSAMDAEVASLLNGRLTAGLGDEFDAHGSGSEYPAQMHAKDVEVACSAEELTSTVASTETSLTCTDASCDTAGVGVSARSRLVGDIAVLPEVPAERHLLRPYGMEIFSPLRQLESALKNASSLRYAAAGKHAICPINGFAMCDSESESDDDGRSAKGEASEFPPLARPALIPYQLAPNNVHL